MLSFSLRIDDADYEALQAMALLTGMPMAELVRGAIAEKLRTFVLASAQAALKEELARRRTAVALLEERARAVETTPHAAAEQPSQDRRIELVGVAANSD